MTDNTGKNTTLDYSKDLWFIIQASCSFLISISLVIGSIKRILVQDLVQKKSATKSITIKKKRSGPPVLHLESEILGKYFPIKSFD